MTFILYLIALVFGLIVGSFLNVVIYRRGTGWSLNGRSKCLSCSQQLKWTELIPLVSFIIQRGKCKKCQAKISNQYPLVEITTALLFALTLNLLGLTPANLTSLNLWLLVMTWGVMATLVLIFVYDLRHKIIPDEFVWTLVILAFMSFLPTLFSIGLAGFLIEVLHALYTGGLVFGLFWLMWYLSQGRLMGLGDAKLVFGLGFWLGLLFMAKALLVAFVLGAVVGLILIGLSKYPHLFKKRLGFNLKSELPFAPFLIIGSLVSYFGLLNIL